jgi:hypothetical protein
MDYNKHKAGIQIRPNAVVPFIPNRIPEVVEKINIPVLKLHSSLQNVYCKATEEDTALER